MAARPVVNALCDLAAPEKPTHVAADGEMLVRVVQRIRRYGGHVEKAFCTVERLDGNSSEYLKARDVDLFVPIRIDEKTLRELRKLPVSKSVPNQLPS